ncbi:MAG: hypothetical protein HY247_00440 [archaeon]|nr:MAG: hypothetical protein HY247_00440 [archaeon]
MGSFFAGIKSGTVAGIVYVAGLAAFNVATLVAYKPDVLAQISKSFPQTCVAGAGANATSLDDCYTSVLSLYVPYAAFLGFFVVLAFAGIFGAAYDGLPGRRSSIKSAVVAVLVGAALLVPFNLALVYQGPPVDLEFAFFYPAWTILFGLLMGRFYSRYTRRIEFTSEDPEAIKVLVDGKDFTGKTRTMANNSVHTLRADVADDGSFREWGTSGGVKLEDPRSFDTVLEIEGHGRVAAMGGRKH